MREKIRIGARQSDLARLQAYRVGEEIAKHFKGEITFHFRESLGDKNLHDPLWKMPEKGVFTQDFQSDLLDDKIDLVVHSWKDLPTEQNPNLEILGTLKRADARDLILFKKDRINAFEEKGGKKQLRIFSSSPRREFNLKNFLKVALPFDCSEIHFESVRGNIQTRVKKLMQEANIDALVLAKAALDRLLTAHEHEFGDTHKSLQAAIKQCRFMIVPLDVNPTAAAQGALAIEARKDRSDLRQLVGKINCRETFECVLEEREILKSYGGGCHQKIGVSCQPLRGYKILRLKGQSPSGLHLEKNEIKYSKKVEDLLKVSKTLASKSPPNFFPQRAEQIEFFDRTALESSTPSSSNGKRFYFVAKDKAMPANWDPKDFKEDFFGVSGMASWKKLANRGFWINVSAESLGESAIDLSLSPLVPIGSSKKLTHRGSQQLSQLENLATYEILEKPNALPDLSPYKFFFWPSFSHFKIAYAKYPYVLHAATHFSPPGHTFDLIGEILKTEPIVCLGMNDFHLLLGYPVS